LQCRGGGGFSDTEPSFVPVNVEYNGLTWWNVGMRFKGNSTLMDAWRSGGKKLPFRLDFDEFEDTFEEIDDQRFYGFKKLTFSSGAKDDSLIREKLGGELFRDAGVKVARSSFYRIYLDVGDGNGQVYAGLYTMVEDLSDDFLKSQFEDDNGNLYKPDGNGADWQSFIEDGFIKKSNEEDADWTDIQNAIDALHASQNDAEAWRTDLERHFNVDQYLKLLAVNQSIENWDTYGLMTHNYYLYADPSDNGRLLWLPWDLNECLQPSRGGGMSVLLSEVSDQWPVIRYLMDDPVYAAQYYEELATFLDGAFAIDKVENRMQVLHDLVAPFVSGENGEAYPYTNLSNTSAFETSLTQGNYALKNHLQDRHEAVEDALSSVGFE
jgi:spore coat protein CotH